MWTRHGGLFGLGFCILGLPTLWAEPLVVGTRDITVDYQIDEASYPLEAVEIWATSDHGKTWQHVGMDDDRQSPAVFRSPSDGLFGLTIILENPSGRSMPAPSDADDAAAWVLVDSAPPVVQLHELRSSASAIGQRTVQIRWTVIDAGLPQRPVEILYRRPPELDWHPLTVEPLADTGRYDWIIPEALSGPLAIQITVRDLADHSSTSEIQSIDVPAFTTAADSGSRLRQTAIRTSLGHRTTLLPPTKEAADRAARLLNESKTFKEAGEDREAIARLREAVRLDPMLTDAFSELGGLFYRIGEYDRAIDAYGTALTQQPNLRAALRGSALVYHQKRDYAAAAEKLRAVLRFNPNDAEVWMNLGDTAVFAGDQVLARDCYVRASQIEPTNNDVAVEARKRIQLMADLSRGQVSAKD